MKHFLVLFSCVLLIGGCEIVSPDDPDDPAAGEWLYVSNQGEATVAVIDMGDNELIRTIDLRDYGVGAEASPHHIAVEPDGSHWYVSLIKENRVLKFNREDELVGEAAFETPGMLEVHPERDLLVVGRSMTAQSPPSSIGLIQRSDMSIREVPVPFARPHALAVNGGYAYTASLAENRIMSIDLATDDVDVVPLEGPPQALVQFALTPDAEKMVVTGQLGNAMHVFNLDEPAHPSLVTSLAVGGAPWHPVITPNGRYVYFGNKKDDSVTVVDVRSNTFVTVIEGEGLAEPHGSAVSPDGRYVYISNNNVGGSYNPSGTATPPYRGTVVVIETATNTIEKVIEVGVNPTGIGR